MTQLFERYAIVDWSAANTPTTGRDSIWICLAERRNGETVLIGTSNPSTRSAATAELRQFFRDSMAAGQRVFAGFDFAFGYPAGAAAAIGGAPDWRAVWAHYAETIRDLDNNTNNRFEVAGRLNRERLAHAPMFWGRPQFQEIPGLTPTKPSPYPSALPERRIAEARARSAQPVWKLHTTGAVGSQTITGMARLEQLRREPEFSGKLSVWPFETGFDADLSAPVVLAEIYPGLANVALNDSSCPDEAQVRHFAELFCELDGEGRFQPLLSMPGDLSEAERAAVLSEEGWIVGLGHRLGRSAEPDDAPAGYVAPQAGLAYLRDPAKIYAESFRTIRAEADLSAVPEAAQDLAIRLIHACGMTDIVGDLRLSADAIEAGIAALGRGAPILCDAEMVSHGILTAALPHQNKIVCRLNDPRTRRIAEREGTTRSAAQIDLWGDLLDGAIVAIGNAPTALFRLLERLDEGAPKPALILGLPVGFVGAAEAKADLQRDPRGVPFVTLAGRRGGSAMAAAAVNALAGGLGQSGGGPNAGTAGSSTGEPA